MAIRDWRIVTVLASIALKIWAASGAALLISFILYCFYGGLFAFVMLLVAASGILYHAQDHLLYHPESPQHSRVFIPVPSMHGLPYESVNIRTNSSITIHAYWIRHAGDKGRRVPTFLYFHGNAGNIGHRLQNTSHIYNFLHCNVLMVEYRGYGLSTGAPNERGFYSDARAAMDWLLNRHDLDHQQIVLFGRSLGGAVAVDLAADAVYGQKIMGIILENTFTSIPEMAVHLIHPCVRRLPLCFYKNKYLSEHKIQFLSAPVLFVSGLADTLVPPRMMSKLHIKCGSIRKELLQIADGAHNTTWTASGYYSGLAKFITECRQTKLPLETPPVSTNPWPQIQNV